MTKTAILTIGIPCAGKTHWAAEAGPRYDAIDINLDDCREAISGDASDQSCTPEAVALHTQMVDAAISLGRNIIVSDTNINEGFRNALIRKLGDAGYAVSVLPFTTDFETCLVRNSRRVNPVPHHAMVRMFEAMVAQGFYARARETA